MHSLLITPKAHGVFMIQITDSMQRRKDWQCSLKMADCGPEFSYGWGVKSIDQGSIDQGATPKY
jgi:hypothetical protein